MDLVEKKYYFKIVNLSDDFFILVGRFQPNSLNSI